jgi:signal transduction histidine kinase
LSDKAKILLVDDRPENLIALRGLLKGLDADVYDVGTGPEALELLLNNEFALAVLDVQMPGMDGYELAELMRGNSRTRPVPIIFVTAGSHSRANTFRGYESGAVDFLNKPLDPYVVKSKVEVFLELARHSRIVREQLEETRKALASRDEALGEAREALQSRDEFFSIASHELKTPLTSLLLQLQLLNRQLSRPEGTGSPEAVAKAGASVKGAIEQAGRLSRLVDELLDLTHIRLGKLSLSKSNVNICQVARDVFDRLKPMAQQKNVPFEFEAPREILGTWDPVRLEQIFSNLLTNALKYAGGTATRMRVFLSSDENVVCVSVKDEGPGIAHSMQEKIFERFERATADNQVSGLGLGLYITRQIARAHGGNITVVSEEGKGCEFVITLPRISNEDDSPKT